MTNPKDQQAADVVDAILELLKYDTFGFPFDTPPRMEIRMDNLEFNKLLDVLSKALEQRRELTKTHDEFWNAELKAIFDHDMAELIEIARGHDEQG